MKQAVEWTLALVALILTGAFLSAVSGAGGWFPRGDSPSARDDRYFHAGKTTPISVDARGCRSTGCHAGMPHVEDRTQAAFRNMHVAFVDCLVCHGRDSRKSWILEPPAPAPKQGGGDRGFPRKRWKLAVPTPGTDRATMHGLIGPALSCRKCHSDDGHREMSEKGIRDLPPGFNNPVALRMIEEGAKQWIPDTMR